MDTHIDLWFAASIVVISLLLSAFFAGAETALEDDGDSIFAGRAGLAFKF